MFNYQPFNKFVYNRRAGIAYRFHPILEASYQVESPEVNRAFIVGQDAAGSLVSGNAVTQMDVDLVGERLDVKHDSAVVTATVAGYVAAAFLAKARLDGKRGSITIPPHCGIELWDVISIVDIPANQSVSYRVTGYKLEYDTREGRYLHCIALSVWPE